MKLSRGHPAGAIAAGLVLMGSAPLPAPATDQAAHGPAAAPFAVILARAPTPAGPDAWAPRPDAAAGAGSRRGGSSDRQAGRWAMARAQIGRSRGPEALGILEVMQADDPDLAYVDSFRLARGAAQALSRRPADAVATLASPGLATNPEACAWRLVAQVQLGAAPGNAARCATAAIDARPPAARRPWRLALARDALAAGSPAGADAALRHLAPTDPEANLLRGEVLLALDDPAQARFFFRRAETDGWGDVKAAATLALLRLRLAADKPDPAARKGLQRFLRTWRGDRTERDALHLAHTLAAKDNDTAAALDTGQTLLDYHDLGAEAAPLLARLQALLAALIAPDSGQPLETAAGLFWDHRSLLPPGTEGDRLVQQLATRLEQAGLARRAAELLRHQMLARAEDAGMGALSIRVATLYLRAGQPETALAAIRDTARTPYPDAMVAAREQLRAVALARLGRKDEALALLAAVPGSTALRHEILWHAADWPALADGTATESARKLPLTAERTTLLLRRAIALALLGRTAELADLRAAQAPLFAASPSGPVFLALTAPGPADPARLAVAMQSLPSASPAGRLADLLPPWSQQARPAAGPSRQSR